MVQSITWYNFFVSFNRHPNYPRFSATVNPSQDLWVFVYVTSEFKGLKFASSALLNSRFHAMCGSQNMSVSDEHSSTELYVLHEKSRYPGPLVWIGWSAAHNPAKGPRGRTTSSRPLSISDSIFWNVFRFVFVAVFVFLFPNDSAHVPRYLLFDPSPVLYRNKR